MYKNIHVKCSLQIKVTLSFLIKNIILLDNLIFWMEIECSAVR